VTTSKLSTVRRWVVLAAVMSVLAIPAAAVGSSSDLPRGIMGPSNEAPAPGGLAERTPTELNQRTEARSVARGASESDFAWSDAGIGAGVTIAAIALVGGGLWIRRRAHTRTQPAV
jgi:hypothetical protein